MKRSEGRGCSSGCGCRQRLEIFPAADRDGTEGNKRGGAKAQSEGESSAPLWGAHGGFFSFLRTISVPWDVVPSGAGEQVAAVSSAQGRLSRTGWLDTAQRGELELWRVLGGEWCWSVPFSLRSSLRGLTRV